MRLSIKALLSVSTLSFGAVLGASNYAEEDPFDPLAAPATSTQFTQPYNPKAGSVRSKDEWVDPGKNRTGWAIVDTVLAGGEGAPPIVYIDVDTVVTSTEITPYLITSACRSAMCAVHTKGEQKNQTLFYIVHINKKPRILMREELPANAVVSIKIAFESSQAAENFLTRLEWGLAEPVN